jgi:PTS system galactitol-specific IIA component
MSKDIQFGDVHSRLFVSVHPNAINKRAILFHLAQRLFEEGCVQPDYASAVVKREQEFPTGLRIGGPYNVALTHAGPEYVVQNAIVMSVLDRPIDFQLMEDPGQTIPVQVVFMFSAKNYNSIIFFIDKLVKKILLKPDVIASLIEIEDEGLIYSCLSRMLFE